ncbi:hypothetical protein niasHT_035732 [Heterodera trifolii]|uniref:B30.2/SPRY domain-containing protein n=1 Tax=Heterodera trifolii TaxID=157864 RepID=A0ABD2IJ96_9BILA
MHERERSVVSVGLWSGTTNASYAYYSNGTILGHNFYGSTGFPKFGHGYIIGCGLNLTTMIAIYTINGRLLYPIWSNKQLQAQVDELEELMNKFNLDE